MVSILDQFKQDYANNNLPQPVSDWEVCFHRVKTITLISILLLHMELLVVIKWASDVWETVGAIKSQEKTAQRNCSLLPRDIQLLSVLFLCVFSQQSVYVVHAYCSVHIDICIFPVCVCVRACLLTVLVLAGQGLFAR